MGVLGTMSNVPGQPFEQHGPRLANSTFQDLKKQILQRSKSIILKQASQEHASDFESLGPHFFCRMSKEQGDVRSDGSL